MSGAVLTFVPIHNSMKKDKLHVLEHKFILLLSRNKVYLTSAKLSDQTTGRNVLMSDFLPTS